MSPITHTLLSWFVGDRALDDDRDKLLVAAAGLLPDLDSAGVVVDLASPQLGGPETELFATYHHFLTHGLLAALAIPALLCLWAKDRARVFFFGVLVFHLHVVCDIVGSRGIEREDIWPLYYLGPFTREYGEFAVSWQWALNGWPNIVLTMLLLVYVFYRLWQGAASPFLPWAPKLHETLSRTLQARFGAPRSAREISSEEPELRARADE